MTPVAIDWPSGDHDGPPRGLLEKKSAGCWRTASLRSFAPSASAIIRRLSLGVLRTKATCLPSGEVVMGLSMPVMIFLGGPPNVGTLYRVEKDSLGRYLT